MVRGIDEVVGDSLLVDVALDALDSEPVRGATGDVYALVSDWMSFVMSTRLTRLVVPGLFWELDTEALDTRRALAAQLDVLVSDELGHNASHSRGVDAARKVDSDWDICP
jgi:hypothetical protein